MFNNQIIAGAAGQGGSFYSHTIGQSLRFDDGSSTVLHRTPSSASNRKTWSFSCWIKLSTLQDDSSLNYSIFSAGSNVYNRRVDISIGSGYQLMFFMDGRADGASYYSFIADRLLRDTAAWMHIMAVMDTTNSTADDRLKLYVNGEQQSGAYQYGHGAPPLNSDWYVNSTYEHDIGDGHHNSVVQFFDGYIAEVNFIDGTALDPTSFGETINGVWVPKAYSGSYGTNGFYLPFDDSSAIGDDESGNTNDWTPSNLAASDVVLDSPTNSFPVLLPGFTQTTQEGGLKLKRSSSGNVHTGCFSTMGVSSGKWYVEIKYEDSAIDTVTFGVAETKGGFDATVDGTAYVETSGISSNTHMEFATWSVQARLSSSYAGTLGSAGSYGSSPSSGDIIQIALDMDDKKIWYGVNGTYIASGDPANGTNASQSGSAFNPTGDVVFVASAYMGRDFSISFNFGQDSANVSSANSDENGIGTFEYAPPSGFLALCSANLPEPTIGPNSGVGEQADDYFDTILYTAASSNGTYTHGNLSFRPDFSWIKNRNNVERHFLTDVVRGNTSVTNKFLVSSATSAEGANGTSGTTFSVTDTGYEFVENSITSGELYYNSRTYVGWNWKAGGAAVSNTDGSITSSVSAAPDAGFSIVQYEGLASGTQTVGHGLNSAPEFIIFKNIDDTSSWVVYSEPVGTSGFLLLNSTGAKNTSDVTNTFNSTSPTSSVFTVGTNNAVGGNGETIIAYCFHSVDGYSKVGSYVGNGNANGTFVYTGFRPAWVLWKRSNGTTGWFLMDSVRDTENVANTFLRPNAADAEGTAANSTADFLSNGFKLRGTGGDVNTSGGTYIYLAFAEAPFKYANAR